MDQQESNNLLSDQQLERYSRQIIMPEISEQGQKQLLTSNIIIVGSGGLGCPVGLYLASAGVGYITIIDNEKIEISNLNRQIAFKFSDLDQSKATTLKKRLNEINPDIKITAKISRLNKNNISECFLGKDLVIDCTDNYETRYLIAEFCFNHRIPMSFGAAVRQEGQTAFFKAGCNLLDEKNIDNSYPCYGCVFPQKPNPNLVSRCSDAGILGPITGIIASIQSLNVLRYLTSQKVSEKLVLWDGFSFYEINLEKNNKCNICGNL